MKTWMRFGLWALATLVALVALAVAVGETMAKRRASRTVVVEVAPVAYRADAESVERGHYLFGSRGCADCHGANGGGRTLVDDGKGTHLAGLNITSGNPALAAYQEVDWVRSIRHGVSPAGRPLRLMPSEDFNRFTDDDLAALVAYVRQLPPQAGRLQPVLELPLLPRVIYGFGGIPEAFEKIDHRLPPSKPRAPAADAAYGEYVVQMCKGCHGPALAGGKIPGGPPDWPAAARLAPGEGSKMVAYAEVDAFARMFKSGKRADGSTIAVMPFESLAKLSDNDVRALFAYLKGLGAAR